MVNYVNFAISQYPSVNWGRTNINRSYFEHAFAKHDMVLASCGGGCGGFNFCGPAPIFGFGFPMYCCNPMIGMYNSFMLGNVVGQSFGLGITLISQLFHKKNS
jgi:hypothetical protein